MRLDQLTKNERFMLPLPIAEHGFSALVNTFIPIEEKKEKKDMNKKVKYENDNKIFLFDTAPSEDGVIYNADILNRLRLVNL